MIYKDTVKLAEVTSDGYGDETVNVLSSLNALFIQRSAVVRDNNIEGVASDATIYLDHTDPIVQTNSYRLEGMYIIAQPFGQEEQESWYRITGVSVGQRKLLDNTVDNVYCQLEKVAGLPYVSIS